MKASPRHKNEKKKHENKYKMVGTKLVAWHLKMNDIFVT